MPEKSKGIEQYEKRFGIIATEKGYITPDDLVEALAVQVREDVKYGTHRLVGEIFLDQDSMTVNQIEEVVQAVLG
jgi:hypothetical protein